jgi:hypothetical protein
MAKVSKIERLSRLIKVSGLIAAGIVDAPVVGEFKKAVLKYVATQSIGTDQALKNLYQSENELGILVRKAFAVIDDQNVRSVATGAIYPRGDRWYLDLLRDPNDERDDDDDDEDADEVEKSAHELSGKLLEHLKDRLDRRRRAHGYEKRKESDNMDSLTKIIKDVGPIGVAEQILAAGYAFGIGETEYVDAASRYASELYGLPGDRAFAKLCQSDGRVVRACSVLKAAEFRSYAPLRASAAKSDPAPSAGSAYDELLVKAREYRKTHSDLSEAQAFAKVFSDPANTELAKRERIESAPR